MEHRIAVRYAGVGAPDRIGKYAVQRQLGEGATGIVYETEDRTQAGLYRFIPNTPGRLAAGGKLQMLAVVRRPQLDTRRNQRPLATMRGAQPSR